MIWLTVSRYQEQPGAEKATPALAAFFDTVAYRQRVAFIFRGIDAALDLAKPKLAQPGGTDTHLLGRGPQPEE